MLTLQLGPSSWHEMSQVQLFELGQRAGIYTKTGKLTKRYRDNAEPAA